MEEIRKDPIWYDFFYTELAIGLRKGEICGLMWSDFDSKQGTLSVRRTIHRRRGGGVTAGATKTGAGKRVITLPPSTAELLEKRKKRSYSQWIFCHPLLPEQPLPPDMAYNRMKTLLKRAGLPELRFHDLRHTFATLALQNGVDIKAVSAMLGHYDAGFTLRTYTHTTRQKQDEAARTMGSLMAQVR